jgi:hypothetical protein
MILGIAYFAIIMLAATVMKNPPVGYAPSGFQRSSVRGSAAQDFTLRQALGAWQFMADSLRESSSEFARTTISSSLLRVPSSDFRDFLFA